MNMAEWLRKLGLERYGRAFRENRIEADVLPNLNIEDLSDLGVSLVGDRRRLLDAIAALAGEAPAGPECPLPTPGTPALAGGRPGVPPRAGEGRVGWMPSGRS